MSGLGSAWARLVMCPTTLARHPPPGPWQGFAAGVLSGGVAAVFVTVFGTGTTALLVNSAWVRGLLYHGQHLTASAVYGRELLPGLVGAGRAGRTA